LLIPVLIAIAAFVFMLIFIFGPPYVPTPMPVIKQLIQICKVSTKDIVIDLGSGDGRMLIEAARKGAQTKGWEINPFLVVWTYVYALLFGVSHRVKVYPKSYTTAHLNDATLVFLYNLPRYMPQLETIMQRDLKKGSRIVTYKFKLMSRKPTATPAPDIYIYQIS
jgi:hypothetical protein